MENEKEESVEPATAEPIPTDSLEEEETCTLGEYMKDLEDLKETAEVLFGAQDPSICTFPEGYKPRQTVFTCLTCSPEPEQLAGVCYGCSLNCHEGHNIIELYTKRKFRCDCGNGKFGDKKCSLYEEKDKENQYNTYNHNYRGKFCTCDVFYPDDDNGQELYQCEICEDWYHTQHLNMKTIRQEEEEDLPASSSSENTTPKVHSSCICQGCVQKLPFLMHMPVGKEPFCHSKLTPEQLKEHEPTALEILEFRKRLCKCPECVRVYENAGCDFLTDDEDDIGKFEEESKKKVAEEAKPTAADDMRTIVREVGMEGAQVFYAGVENLKRKLREFMDAAGSDGKPITEDQVRTFFAGMQKETDAKRARFE